ncbi:FAD-dependent oxidoreductase [Haloglycomyces albus]|uniref:FAD-dependent oxidoreductase n=1 Tax=Haloglycomyces albus TaxID=526067 RepID=UPI00046D6579|nr:GMC family oxidoreductase [Haloglycomyces albus]
MSSHESHDYDVVIIGSGFGGSVAALRLTEKGYRVAVLEAGDRFDDPSETDPARRHAKLPRTSWRLRRYLWAPQFGFRGIQRLHLLRGRKGSRVMVLAGAGVGGGSLVYANTLYRPFPSFYQDRQWGHITDWKHELAPYYDQAERMLGVVENPIVTPADHAMRRVADRMDAADTFKMTKVGITFGTKGSSGSMDDPYFGGAGPARSGCVACGACMTGCRYGAKNMLTENYLYLAEKAGAVIHPLTTVTDLHQENGTWHVTAKATGPFRRSQQKFRADQVVMAAGTWGTQNLLHRLRNRGRLPHLSTKLGVLTRTNSEALLGAERIRTKGDDHSKGIAITSSFYPDEHTHVEPVRYGKGSNAMALIRTLMVDGPSNSKRFQLPRWVRLLGVVARRPWLLGLIPKLRRWSERSVIALVMQHRDNSVTVTSKGRGLRAQPGHGEPNPVWLPIGHRATRMLAEEIGAIPGGTWLDLANIPTTAHFLGGCPIGDAPDNSVVDAYHRAWGYPNLHIVDGSAVTANLGVNPSLTITAQAERAMSMWPNKDDHDPRPEQGQPYRPVSAVAPRSPMVPENASGSLRIQHSTE